MTYRNTYTAPTVLVSPETNRYTGPAEYDHYFAFPVKLLRSSKVELRPFVPSLHAEHLSKALLANPELYDWLPWSPLSLDDVLIWAETNRRDPSFCYYAIYSSPPGSTDVSPEDYVFAGSIGMTNASDETMSAELGYIIILPPFQRTHVLTHAAGIMIHRILDDIPDGGLGLRRCQWVTNSLHVKSQTAGKRLGFKQEALIRAHRLLAPGKAAIRPGRKGPKEDWPSRDTWMGSIFWEEWEHGGREHVDGLMNRNE